MSDKKGKSPLFHYANRHRSGAFDVRHVSRWRSKGDSYYRSYVLTFTDGEKVELEPEEFHRFEPLFYEHQSAHE